MPRYLRASITLLTVSTSAKGGTERVEVAVDRLMRSPGEQEGLVGLGPRRGARVQQNDPTARNGELGDGAPPRIRPCAVAVERDHLGERLVPLGKGRAVRGVADREWPATARGVDLLVQEAGAVVVVDTLVVPLPADPDKERADPLLHVREVHVVHGLHLRVGQGGRCEQGDT